MTNDKKYRIDIVQTVVESCTVEVEAESREAAEQEALDIAGSGLRGIAVDWHFIEVEQDAEVIAVQELPERPGHVIDLYEALKRTEQP